MKIANLCYANVSGKFADFTNLKNRGPNFTWERFIRHCEENAPMWLRISDIENSTEDVYQTLACEFASEIARTLVWHVTK